VKHDVILQIPELSI